jgi:geranylgeranyl pyrophosphate synthase
MITYFREYAAKVKPKVDRIFENQLIHLTGDVVCNGPTDLRDALLGGKKIRGCLLCLITQSLGGRLDAALVRAAAVELIQTATLIHDDYIDQDLSRRKLPAIWTLAGARRAVLLGDVIFASAIKMMNELGHEDGTIVSDAIAQVAAGALQEPLEPSSLARQIELAPMEPGLYEKIIHLKTGILFGAACRMGAVAARAPSGVGDAFQRWGQRIGEAYQLADDLHEITSSAAARFIDAKQTASLATVCLNFTPALRSFLLDVLKTGRGDLSPAVVDDLRQTIRRMQQEIEHRLQLAARELRGLFIRPGYRSLMSRTPMDLIAMFNDHDAPLNSVNAVFAVPVQSADQLDSTAAEYRRRGRGRQPERGR